MNKALKKELAVLSGMAALLSLRFRSSRWAALFSAGTAGLYLSSLKDSYTLNGKTAYITGGSRGLGLSLAWNILDRGGAVTLVARDEAELLQARDILWASFPDSAVFLSVCDVTDINQLEDSLAEAKSRMGGIDLLVNNAGSILVGPFSSMEMEDFEAQMKLHLYAAIHSTQLLFAHFKMRGGGRILNICSLGGKISVPHMLPYDASKFALAGFSQGVTAELAPHGIVVTTAYPTVMRTGSAIQAVFKGDHEKEFAWFTALDNMPGLSMSADRAAKKILTAVQEGKSEVILSLPAKARLLVGQFFPETMAALMSFVSRILPQGDSSLRKTGAQSGRLFKNNRFFKPFQQEESAAEAIYNQQPRHEADFNLGLKTEEDLAKNTELH